MNHKEVADKVETVSMGWGITSGIVAATIVNVLRDRNKKTVAEYLFRLKGRDLVKCVAIDMWEPYKDAVRDVMPQATIVIDKFHVVRMANDCLEKVRKEIRGSLTDKQRRGLMHDRFILLKRESNLKGLDLITLESWTKNYPALGAAYRAKEDFFAIYDAMTVQEGITQFRDWRPAWHQRSRTPSTLSREQLTTGCRRSWRTSIIRLRTLTQSH